MSRIRAAVVVVLMAVVSGGALLARQGADDARLLQQAIDLIESKGDYAAALPLLERAAKSEDRVVASRALWQQAELLSLTSPALAEVAYRTLASEFADQGLIADRSRARLAALDGAPPVAQSGPPVPVRLLQSDSLVSVHSVSADGRFAVGTAWSWKDEAASVVESLVTVDLTSGAQTVLVPGEVGVQVFGGALSPDESRVAFAWREAGPGRRSSLRVVETTPSSVPAVLAMDVGPGLFWPAGWTADGQAVLAQRGPGGTTDRATRLLRVPSDGGPAEEVAVFSDERNVSNVVAVSSDGSRVAFSAKPEPGASDKYIYVLDLSTGKEFAAVRVAGVDSGVWSADGQKLFYRTFVANGRRDLWSIDVGPEGAVSEPVRVHSGLPPSVSLTVTPSGNLLFGRAEGAGFATVVRTRTAGAQPESSFGPGSLPAISPDGRSVAFTRGATVTIRDLDSGAERSFPKQFYAIPPVWTPDSQALVMYAHPAADNDSPSGAFYRLDLGSSAYTRLFDRDEDGWVRNVGVAVSRDGRALVALARPESQPGGWTTLVEVDLATGAQRELMTFDEPIPGSPVPLELSLSPDGSSLAILVAAPLQGQFGADLFVASLDAQTLRHVTGPFPISRFVPSPGWTADSGSILVGALNDQGAFQVMRVPASGGALAPDGPSLAEARHPGVAPSDGQGVSVSLDGSRLVFSVQDRGGYELWSLDVRRR